MATSKITLYECTNCMQIFKNIDDIVGHICLLAKNSAAVKETPTGDHSYSSLIAGQSTEQVKDENTETEENDLKQGCVWSVDGIEHLVQTYKNNLEYFNSPMHKKLDVWKKVASEMLKSGYDYNYQECDKKMRALKYRYRLISGSKTTPNKKRPTWEFYHLMDDLMKYQQSVQLTQTSARPQESTTSERAPNTSERVPFTSERVPNTMTEESSDQNQVEHEGDQGGGTTFVGTYNKAPHGIMGIFEFGMSVHSHSVLSEVIKTSVSASTSVYWSYEAVQLLVQRYRHYLPLFKSPVHKKLTLWKKVAKELEEQGYTFSYLECDKKMRALKYRYRLLIQSDKDHTKWEYFSLMDALLTEESTVQAANQSETVQESTVQAASQCHSAQKSTVEALSQCETVQEETTNLTENSDESSDMDVSMTEQLNEFSGDLPEIPSSAICQWSHNAVLLLIELYKKYQELFHSWNYLKIDIWKKVADELQKQGYDYSYEECDKKMRNMKLRYKAHAEGKNQRGIGQQKWKYLELIAEVAQRDSQLALPVSLEGSMSTEEMVTKDDLTEQQELLQTKIWTHRAVLCLVEIYKDNQELFTSRLHKKKTIWKKVAAELAEKGFKYNYISCDKKIRVLKHRYKMIIEGKDQTAKNNQTWKYFSLMDDLLAGDPVFWASRSLASLSKECSVVDELPDENELEIDILDDDKLQKQSSVEPLKKPTSTVTTWTHKAILCLLKTYREHLACFTSREYKKADVYKKIASELQKQGLCYNRHQCDKKMRSLKYRYRLLLEGCDPCCRRRWRYYSLIDKLLADDPTLKQKKGCFVHSKDGTTSSATIPSSASVSSIPSTARPSTSAISPKPLPQPSAPSTSFSAPESGTQTRLSQEQAGPPKKKLKKSKKPPAWFVAFAEEQRKTFAEIKELQKISIQVAKERTELMKTFMDAVLHKT